ncbi:hypothetical protein B566_EDAN013587 [Ephemera danica]|nr:hypothetical protein B566_EDAN013587 [Ephemera danica]
METGGSLQGYMFEPSFTEEELLAMEAAEAADDTPEKNAGRSNNTDWCTCIMCSPMPDDKQKPDGQYTGFQEVDFDVPA